MTAIVPAATSPETWLVAIWSLTAVRDPLVLTGMACVSPAEMFAAAVWFTLITWLMFKTKNIWDCVAAHAVTNLLLGVYVVLSGDWYFM